MTINRTSDVVIQPYPRTPYDKQSENDKVGMKGDRSEIGTTYNYQPAGTDKEIRRIRGSLRMKRGDTSILTLAKTYGEFCTLVGLSATTLPGIQTLADARKHFGEASITGIRKAVRERS